MQEYRIASVGSLRERIQRSPSRTDWPGSNGTSWVSKRPASRCAPRQTRSVANSAHAAVSAAVGIAACDICRPWLSSRTRLVDGPFLEHSGMVLALVCAAALGALSAASVTALRHGQHVAQVVPVEPGHVVRVAANRPGGRPIPRSAQRGGSRAREAVLRAQRADIIGHDRIEAARSCARCSRARRWRPLRTDRVPREGGRPSERSSSRLPAPRRAPPGHAAEHQRLRDRVAGEPVGAIRAADRFSRHQKAGHFGASSSGFAATPPI